MSRELWITTTLPAWKTPTMSAAIPFTTCCATTEGCHINFIGSLSQMSAAVPFTTCCTTTEGCHIDFTCFTSYSGSLSQMSAAVLFTTCCTVLKKRVVTLFYIFCKYSCYIFDGGFDISQIV